MLGDLTSRYVLMRRYAFLIFTFFFIKFLKHLYEPKVNIQFKSC